MNPTADQLARIEARRTAAVARVRRANPRIRAREVYRRVDQAARAARAGVQR